MVKVPPLTSSGESRLLRALSATSSMRVASPSCDSSWASRITGTISPSSPSDTAMPRCTGSCTLSNSPSNVALMYGCWRSASIVVRATYGRYERLPRAASMRLMSASTIVVQCAAVRSERTMCSAIRLRITESSRPRPASAPVGSGARVGAGSSR